MDPANILPSLENLDDAVDNLEEALQPLVDNVTDVASKLPLLDKAKFYVLMTYSIESMLFSTLRLNEVDAKEHPIFKELSRVRQYFDKIKNIEFPQKPEQSINKEAAIRFIRSDLADNKEINTKLTEMIAKERAKAALKTRLGEKRKLDATTPEAKSNEDESKDADSAEESEEDEVEVEPQPEKKKSKKEKNNKSERKEKKEKGEKGGKAKMKNKKSSKE
ncbi:Sas10/Utp3/C1D family-domain-containing protein [Xylaria digitata]|nr:Sas10/Utp3/C1D family-domain-containing protein [Xylaria digitata]